ncbi:MAG: redoxin domain-containing protein [Halioglobus sp.]
MKAVKQLCFFLFFCGIGLAAHADGLKVGDMAPTFKLEASDGNTYDLAFFKGKRAVVIAWFPKAYTSGCTVECKSLASNGHLIRKYDVAYFMASVDELADNIGFAEETGADFPLLSDPSKAVAEAYGVLQSKGYAARRTFYIGIDGRILKIDNAVNPATSAEDMGRNLKALGISPIAAAP